MKAGLFVLFAAATLGATSVEAQGIDTGRCPPGTVNAFGVPDQARASQDACQKAIDLFWVRRDPTPGTLRNEFREEFEARVVYADKEFKFKNKRGALDDEELTYLSRIAKNGSRVISTERPLGSIV